MIASYVLSFILNALHEIIHLIPLLVYQVGIIIIPIFQMTMLGDREVM